MNRFISVHALGFIFFNMVHLTNWIINGLPERFPKLKVLWIESGLAWVPFMMQRLDNEYMMRSSEAPALKKLPSDYMRDMFFSTQPMEMTDMAALEQTFRMIKAETQLLYSSDYPHWDFDLPSTIYDLPFLGEKAKRNILGGNAVAAVQHRPAGGKAGERRLSRMRRATGRTTMRKTLALAAAGLLFASAAAAQDAAANYPNRPIRIIVCVPAGGGVDTVTRLLANGLQGKLGQPVIVENRAGAAGNIGAEAVFTADPDGYTLLAAQPSPLTINPLLYKDMRFDPAKFEPVMIMTTVANVLLVRPGFPAKTAQEFIAYAKANPGKVNYASQGIGTTSHLTAELFARVTGTSLVHVPFKGTTPALNELIADRVDMIFMELASAINLHKAGRAHILAVATAKRIPELPDIPTLDEAGVKGFEFGHMERHCRTAEDAAGDRRQAQQGAQRRDGE